MPANTPGPWSIPYPLGTDRVTDGDNAMQNIALRVAALLADANGTPTVAPVAMNLASGWTGSMTYMVRGGWVYINVNVTRVSWPVNTVVGYLTSTYWPRDTQTTVLVGASSGATQTAQLVNTNGYITALAASTGSGGGLLGYFAYPSPYMG